MGLVSCGGEKEPFRTEVFECEESYPLAEGTDACLSVGIKIEYPVAGAPEEVLARIDTAIVERTVGPGSLEEAVRSYIDAAVADYRANAGDLLRWAEEEGAGSGPLNWEEQKVGTVYAVCDSLLSYDIYAYSYQGGAHGLSGTESLVFDLRDGHLVMQDELFAPGCLDALGELLSSHLREAMPDEDSYDALFVKDIEPNGNFRVSKKGVTYIYNPYSIGPYYLGAIEVTVPWEEIEPLLKNCP